MKIGLSFSRCIREIYEGLIDPEDVLIIIARTNFDPNDDKQWSNIWIGYRQRMGLSNPEWIDIPEEDEDKLRALCITIYNDGKLHQPRKFGAHPPRRNEIWLETVLPDSELKKNPAAMKAWNQFQTIAGLTNVNLDKEYK